MKDTWYWLAIDNDNIYSFCNSSQPDSLFSFQIRKDIHTGAKNYYAATSEAEGLDKNILIIMRECVHQFHEREIF